MSTGGQQAADVLVVFGITGDLAKVMTFRSLYRLEQRGLLDCPIVGVAVDDWTVDQLRRARPRVDRRHRRAARRGGVRPARGAASPTCTGDFADAATYERVGAGDQGRRAARSSTSRSRRSCSADGRQGPRRGRPDRRRACRRREAVRSRPGVGARARRRAAPVHRRVAALPDRPLPREDGPRGDPLPALREHDARAGLEPQLRRVRADHDGRGLRRRGPRPLLRPGRRAARRRRQPPDAGGRGRGDGGAVARRPRRRSRTRRSRVFRAIVAGRSRRTTCAASTTATATSTASPPTRRPRPTPRCGSRSRTGAGRACRSSSAPASGCRSPRPSCGSSSSTPPQLGFGSASTAPEPNQLVIKLDPSHRRPAGPRRAPGRRGRRRSAIELDMEFAEEGGEGPTPYEVLLHAAMVGDSTRFTRQDGVEETWRIMQPLLDAPPPVHPYAPGSWGPEAADELVAGHGRWHGPWIVSCTDDRPPSSGAAERGRAVAVPADRGLRLPLELPHRARWSRRTARSTGSACPRFDSPSVFGSLLDRAGRVLPASGPFGINHPTARGVRAGHERARHDLEDADRLGRRARRADDGPAWPRGRGHAAHAAAGRRRRRPHARAHGRVPRRPVEVELVCEPAVRLRPRRRPSWTLVDGSRHAADATGAAVRPIRLVSDLALGIEGDRVAGPARARSGRPRVLRALAGPRSSPRPTDVDEAAGQDRRDDALLAPLARPGAHPRPPLARPDPALGARDQGPHLHADRRHRRGAHHVAARDARAASATGTTATRWMRDSTFTLQALHYLNLDWEADEFMQFVADLEPTRTARCRSCTASTAAAT